MIRKVIVGLGLLAITLGAAGGIGYLLSSPEAATGTGPNIYTDELYAPNGTVTLPSYSFDEETDLGLYRSAAKTLNIALPTNGKVGINEADPDTTLHVTSTVNALKIESTLSDGQENANLIIYRNPDGSSPSSTTGRSTITFTFNNANGKETEVAEIVAEIADSTAGSEDGRLYFRTATAGVLTGSQNRWQIEPAGHWLPSSDNAYDLGDSSTGSLRNVYVDTELFTPQVRLTGVTFANLGGPADGTTLYCSDCTKATPCNSGGNGAIAKRLNGAWDCD